MNLTEQLQILGSSQQLEWKSKKRNGSEILLITVFYFPRKVEINWNVFFPVEELRILSIKLYAVADVASLCRCGYMSLSQFR